MYGVKFAPKTKPFTIEEDGEAETYYVSQKAVLDGIRENDKNKGKPEKSGEQSNRDMISKYVVHEDGSPISAEEVENILGMRPSAFQKFSKELTAAIIGESVEQAKKD